MQWLSEMEGVMSKYIVTVSREFGCGARQIVRELASKLGVKLYDKELVDLAAAKAGLNTDIVKDSDEIINKKQNKLFKEFGYGSSTKFYSEQAVQAQVEVIHDLANKPDSCIMFGRCADYVLREYDETINFFLYAPLEARIRHISKDYELDLRNAEKMIKRVDRQRHNYYKYVTGHNRGDRHGKDVMIDVSSYGIEGTVQLMYEAIAIKVGKENM